MNLFELPDELPAQEVFDQLVQSDEVLVERIVSNGQQTPVGSWLQGREDEWVAVLQGHAELAYEDGARVELGPGDHLLIAAGARHRVETTSTDPPCIWLAVHAGGLGRY